MLQVPIDKIVPLTTARDTLSKIIADVEGGTPMYIFTKNGKPSVAVVSIDYLQKQMGPVQTVSPPPEPAKITFEPHQETPAPPASGPVSPPAEPPDASFWGSFPQKPEKPAEEITPIPAPAPNIDPKPVDTIKPAKPPAPSIINPPVPPTVNPGHEPDDMDIG